MELNTFIVIGIWGFGVITGAFLRDLVMRLDDFGDKKMSETKLPNDAELNFLFAGTMITVGDLMRLRSLAEKILLEKDAEIVGLKNRKIYSNLQAYSEIEKLERQLAEKNEIILRKDAEIANEFLRLLEAIVRDYRDHGSIPVEDILRFLESYELPKAADMVAYEYPKKDSCF